MSDEDLQKQVQVLQTQVDALRDELHSLKAVVLGDSDTFIEEEKITAHAHRLDRLDDVTETLEQDVAEAIAHARATADGGQEVTKKQVAYETIRDKLVKDCLVGTGSKVAYTTVQDLAEPEYGLKYQTVKDAAKDLRRRFPEFETTTDPNAAVVNKDQLSREVVLTVQDNLGRDDLVKRLISERGQGGGS